jgi:hypothetical protein
MIFDSKDRRALVLSPEICFKLCSISCHLAGKSSTFPYLRGLQNGDTATSKIKQVASGRFGVTPEFLVNADQLEIKIAQVTTTSSAVQQWLWCSPLSSSWTALLWLVQSQVFPAHHALQINHPQSSLYCVVSTWLGLRLMHADSARSAVRWTDITNRHSLHNTAVLAASQVPIGPPCTTSACATSGTAHCWHFIRIMMQLHCCCCCATILLTLPVPYTYDPKLAAGCQAWGGWPASW